MEKIKLPQDPTVLFLASKKETFRVGENYKTFHKKLKTRFNIKVAQ